jgi:hypothetical protein
VNLLFSTLYAPIVFYCLQNFEIKTVALLIFFVSLIWLGFSFKKGIKEFFFPLIYLFIAVLAFLLNSFILLKLLPFLISFVISCFIFYTYISQNSFIFIFLEKIKKEVEENEKEYIQKSTLFWFFSSIINLMIHGVILFIDNMQYWTIYSSFGWYFVFIITGIIQFVHKKLYFKKR